MANNNYSTFIFLKGRLLDLPVAELVDFHNEYCYRTKQIDKLIFKMGELDDLIGMENPKDVLTRAYLGDFNLADIYVYVNERDWLFSFTDKNDKNCKRIINESLIARNICDECEINEGEAFENVYPKYLVNIE